MLGTGLMAFGLPMAITASLSAVRGAPDRFFAMMAVGLAAVDLLAVVGWVVFL
jgi:hypothetical protein